MSRAPVVEPVTDERGHDICRVTCQACGAVARKRRARDQDVPTGAAFAEDGWHIDPGRAIKCPNCRQRERAEGAMTMQHSSGGQNRRSRKAPQPTPAETVRIRDLIDAHWDGGYEQGWSDKRVAQELGLPPTKVVTVRKEVFGDVPAPPEVDALRSEIESLESMLGEARARLAELEKRYKEGRL